MRKKYFRLLLVVVLASVALFHGIPWRHAFTEGANRNSGLIKIIKVNDGDTITVNVGSQHEKIRLIGIDSPEMGQRPWGEKAKEHLEGLLASSSNGVNIEYDIEHRDKYGRLLAYVRTKDGKMVNEEMLRSGYAVLFTIPPNVKYVERFISAQKKAQDKKLGIWGRNGLKQRPFDYRKEHPRIR